MTAHRRAAVAALIIAPLLALLATHTRALAWDAHGHRVITLLALDAAFTQEPALPGWLNTPEHRARAAYQAAEPDRWRGQRTPQLINQNNPDHYIDIEDLEPFGLTLETIPPLRSRYAAALASAKALHPERFTDYDPAADPHADKEYPGFLLHAIVEHYARLQASFRTWRILEALDEPDARAHQLAQARANIIYHLGALSHFVADAAQPLHTTRHFNGWKGEPGSDANPHGYTTSNRFHAYIDGGVVDLHEITYQSLRRRPLPDRAVSDTDPWGDTVAHVARSFAFVEDLYRMEKDGSLQQEPGKHLIEERFLDAAATLSAFITAAWRTSEPDGAEIRRFIGWTPAD